MRKYCAAQRDAIYRWRHKSEENMNKQRLTVRRAFRKKILEAKEILSDSLIPACAEPGCQADINELEFHHKAGDGKSHAEKLGGRETYKMACWIVNNPGLAHEKMELRCFTHHREADVKLHLFPGGLGRISTRRKLTAQQVRRIRKSYKRGVHGKTLCVLAKRYGVFPKTISFIVTGKTYKDLL